MQETATLPRIIHEYRIAKGWLITCYFLCALLAGPLLWCMGTLLFPTDTDAATLKVLLIVSPFTTLLGIWCLLECRRAKFTLYEDRMIETQAFRTKKLLFKDIKGFQFTEQDQHK